MTTKNKSLFSLLCFILSLIAIIFYFLSKAPEKRTLRILTYSSFAGVYGPGRKIKEQFESFCGCELQWFLAEDSTALLQRFALIPGIDIVIGWDQITLKSAEKKQWEDISSLKQEFVKVKDFEAESFFQNPYFLPMDWAPVGFISRDKAIVPASLKSLYKIQGKISFPEPRSSSLGIQFYYWMYEVFEGDKKQLSGFLKKLKDKIYGPVFSWSLAYGFFQKGQTDMGLSYLSSLIYHKKQEKDKKFFFSYFEEGHPYQIEFLSVSRESKNKDLAIKFAKFLLSKEVQQGIRETHYMFPVSKELSDNKLLDLNRIRFISYKRLDEFIKKKKELLKLWEENLY